MNNQPVEGSALSITPHYVMGMDLADSNSKDMSVIAVFLVDFQGIRMMEQQLYTPEFRNKIDPGMQTKLMNEQIEKFKRYYGDMKVIRGLYDKI